MSAAELPGKLTDAIKAGNGGAAGLYAEAIARQIDTTPDEVVSRVKAGDGTITEAVIASAKTKAIAKASRVLSVDYEPQPYPVAALGPLAEVVGALAAGLQVDPALAGQSVLAVAALGAQQHADVRALVRVAPLSLNLLSVGDSGCGKSTVDDEAMRPVHAVQRREQAHYQTEQGRRGKDDPPLRHPYRVVGDSTIEGIRNAFRDGLPSQAAMTSEGAQVVCGFGFSPENRLKTAGGLNQIWDSGRISVARGMTGRLELYDRRLSVHWLLQPDAIRAALADPALTNVGLLPRFLVAWPAPPKPKKASDYRADGDPAVGRFWQRVTDLLSPLPDDLGGLPVIEASPEADRLFRDTFERLEVAARGKDGPLADVLPFAVRATEHACRIAAVMATFDGGRAQMDLADARNAITLVTYSLDTWQGIRGDRDVAAQYADASLLYRWLIDQDNAAASETAMLRVGPHKLRSRDRRDGALAVLEGAKLVTFNKQTGRWVALGIDA